MGKKTKTKQTQPTTVPSTQTIKPKNKIQPNKQNENETKEKKLDLSSMSVDDFLSDGFFQGLQTTMKEEKTQENPKKSKETLKTTTKQTQTDEKKKIPAHLKFFKKKTDEEGEKSGYESDDESDQESDQELDEKESDQDLDEKEPDNEKNDADQSSESEDSVDPYQAIKQHKADLKELQSGSQAEFFNYLKEQGSELLQFVDEKSEESSEIEGSDVEEEDKSKSKKPKKSRTGKDIFVTRQLLDKWKEGISKNEFRPLTRILRAFHAAIAMVTNKQSDIRRYFIQDGTVFNSLMIYCISNLGVSFYKYLNPESTEPPSIGTYDPTIYPNWKHLRPLLLFFFTNLFRFLKTVTEKSMLEFILKNLAASSAVYLVHFTKLLPRYMKYALRTWSKSDDLSVQFQAFLILSNFTRVPRFRNSTKSYPYLLKSSFLSAVRVAKNFNASNVNKVNFMRNCVVEFYGKDLELAYRYCFIYIRQLANYLKHSPSMTNLNWRFFHSIKLLSDITSAYPKEPLKSLIHPLVMIIQAILERHKNNAKFWPIRLQLVQILNKISFSSGFYINSQVYLLELLESINFRTKYASKLKEYKLDLTLRTKGKEKLEWIFVSSCFNRAVSLLTDAMCINAVNVAFPELIVPYVNSIKTVISHLSDLRKKTDRFIFKKSLTMLNEMFQEHAQLVLKKRKELRLDPQQFEKTAQTFSEHLSDINLSPLLEYRAGYQARLDSGDMEHPIIVVPEEYHPKGNSKVKDKVHQNPGLKESDQKQIQNKRKLEQVDQIVSGKLKKRKTFDIKVDANENVVDLDLSNWGENENK
eukprot:TRINITY_DN1088_c0_g1_i1.p1 TRINITY_DN1088_c0_g1~~TRINITY_DN1088_c0_g1_i1.p1  ORF type:complete len:809 (-),score=178.40 TRINITY_DN1088_c0_g1_i1:43-2469(-)